MNLTLIDRGMQQGDQTVLSLRPGGGRGSRLLGGSSSSSSSSSLAFGSLSSDLPLFRPHGGAPPPFSIKVQSFYPFLFKTHISVILDLVFLICPFISF